MEADEGSSNDRPMRRLGDLMPPNRPPTEKEVEAIAEVHALAAEYATLQAKQRPTFLVEVRRLTTGRQRHLATRFTPPDDRMFRPVMALLDGLIATDPGGDGRGVVQTKHGLIEMSEAAAMEVQIEREDGRECLVYPVRYPWERKPDPDHGVEGIRAPAQYRAKDDRGPRVTGFRVKITEDEPRQQRDPEWWETIP